MEEKTIERQGIAEYLDLFERSPYSLPASKLVRVEGTSTLNGIWHLANSPSTAVRDHEDYGGLGPEEFEQGVKAEDKKLYGDLLAGAKWE